MTIKFSVVGLTAKIDFNDKKIIINNDTIFNNSVVMNIVKKKIKYLSCSNFRIVYE